MSRISASSSNAVRKQTHEPGKSAGVALINAAILTTVCLLKAGAVASIGDFEQLILLALIRLGPEAYGVSIRQDIEARTTRTISAGALYTALNRLEHRGFVTSRLGEPTPMRGGKRKRLYSLRPAGEESVARAYDSLRQMASGLGVRLRVQKS